MKKLIFFILLAGISTSLHAKSPWDKLHDFIDDAKEKYEEAKENFNDDVEKAKLK